MLTLLWAFKKITDDDQKFNPENPFYLCSKNY